MIRAVVKRRGPAFPPPTMNVGPVVFSWQLEILVTTLMILCFGEH